MNSFLSRALAKTASTLSTTKRRRFLQQPSLFLQSYAATAKTASAGNSASRKTAYKLEKPKVFEPTAATTGKPEPGEKPAPKVWERPSEIPFQAKVANSVNLIGKVHIPVQFEASPDGKCWAGTVITQDHPSDSSHLWIPIIFEGDLAHIAACHLKENDCVHVAGQLSADPPHVNTSQGQANMQVIVNSLNLVQGYPQMKKNFTSHEKEIPLQNSDGAKKSGDPVLNSWRELLDDPNQWRDYRDSKRNGSVNPRYPDFKNKVGGQGLWLSSAPKLVLSQLEGLKFDVQTQKSKQAKQQKGEQSWKDLVENPGKWWDNRSRKTNAKAPDFKHKDTGEALWLNDSPAWVLSKLPPLKSKDGVIGWRDTLLS